MRTELYPAHVQAADEITRMEPGHVYPYSRFAELCRAPIDSAEVRYCRLRTLEILRGKGINLRPKRGHGYQRLTESERVRRQAPLARAKALRALRRGAQDTMTVDVAQLSPEEVRLLSEHQSRLGALTAVLRLRQPQRYSLARLPEVPRR